MLFVALEFDDLLSLFMQIYSQIFMIPLDEIHYFLFIPLGWGEGGGGLKKLLGFFYGLKRVQKRIKMGKFHNEVPTEGGQKIFLF